MILGVPRETFPDEHRVALIPANIPSLKKAGYEIRVESGAGEAAGYPDSAYEKSGGVIVEKRAEVFASADVIVQVRGYCANPEAAEADLPLMREGQAYVGFMRPCSNAAYVKTVSQKKIAVFAMELIPRISRAQSMDTLSSMMTIVGYKAVLMAADRLPRMFPMLMTAAGTVAPAKVFIVGAGVSGLQAIATSRRLGAVVKGYDIRPAVREQVESLGAAFVEIEVETAETETKGGYARQMDEAFYRKQRELMGRVVSESDVVITTAAIPGKKAPVLIIEDMVKGMTPGSIVVDVAAESGGNCALTEAGKIITRHDVTIVGATNLPSTIPYHASQLYSKNITNFLLNLTRDGQLALDSEDEIIRDTLVARDGRFLDQKIRVVLDTPKAPPEK